MSSVRFEKESHTYWLPGGRRLPSVTEILKSAGLIPENDFATFERGTEVHNLTAMNDLQKGVGWHTPYPPGTIEMVVAWRKFIDEYGKDWILKSIEEPIANETHGFAGTPDRIVWNKEKKRYAVVEIKTGAAAQWHRLQTAAYKFLFSTSQLAVEEQANGPVDRIAVYLKSDGTFSVEQHDYPLQRCRDKDIFLAALACTNWRIKHGAFFKKEN